MAEGQHGGADLFGRGRDKLAGWKQTCENAEKLSHLPLSNGLRPGHRQALVSKPRILIVD